MNKKTTALSIAISLALGSGFISTAAHAEEQQVEKLQKMKVTGSRISTTDMEGPNPVDVYTASDIADMGAVSVDDVLRGLTQNGSGSYGNNATNSFAAGTSGVSLRGLGSSRTLVLLNGRRVANYAFGQNMNDTFVDLNSIPLSAVERIDVLKDGASALYGSDAIAGVINIILKRDYEGFEIKTKSGVTSEMDGEELNATITAGKTFNDDKTNIMVSFNAVNKGNIMREDRSNTSSADLTDRGGFDWTSSRGNPGYAFDVDGNYLGALCGQDANGNELSCNYDYASDIAMIPESNRYSLLSTINHQLNDDVNSFLELALNRVETTTISATTPTDENDGIIVAADNPFNTFGQDVKLRHRMTAAPNRVNDVTTDSARIVTGLEGLSYWGERDIEWNADVGYHYTQTKNVGSGYINRAAYQALIDNGTYNPFSPHNSADSIAPAVTETTRKGKSQLAFLNAGAAMPVYELPAGDIQMAFGGEFRYESAEDTPDSQVAAGEIIGSGGTSSKGDRNVIAAYTEFMIPVHETTELQLAGRFEHYNDFGSAFSPKAAIRFQPHEIVVFRGSYSQGFKAPTLPELYMGSSTSYQNLVDTTGEAAQFKVVSSGNEDLEAEKSESFNFGVVVEPIEDLSITADIYRITNKDKISRLSSQDLIDNDSPNVIRDDGGNIVQINNVYLNLDEQEVQGIDMGIDYTYETLASGSFDFSLNGSYIDSFKITDSDGVTTETAGKDTGGVEGGGPRFKGNGSVIWAYQDFKFVNRINYTHSYDALYATEKFTEIDSLTTWDTQLAYSGIEQMKIAFGINNVTDELAPFSNDSNGYDIVVHNNVGRFIYLDLAYQF